MLWTAKSMHWSLRSIGKGRTWGKMSSSEKSQLNVILRNSQINVSSLETVKSIEGWLLLAVEGSTVPLTLEAARATSTSLSRKLEV